MYLCQIKIWGFWNFNFLTLIGLFWEKYWELRQSFGMDQQWVHECQNEYDFGGVALTVFAGDLILSSVARYANASVSPNGVFRLESQFSGFIILGLSLQGV